MACCLLYACNDTTFRSSVPSYPVHLQRNLLAEYPHFLNASADQYLIFKEQRYPTDALGYAGILVQRDMDARFRAYDLACPHCLNREQTIIPDGIFAVCPICQEAYDLSYGLGIPTKGKSKEALRQYNAQYNNGYLTITNQ
ncbi:MAG: hypothetical protein NC038_07060 [Paludibacter sp.]|nr:hypothetical protein [Bacteroidales bacterium]MCM1069671.1 hypothetical protein [Prevotella sp.]MCM1354317.1 hypothetical protein [Bacteroides sp.]MCM1443144.1 hypothetical protein [Muribaculum sp.]MCM1482379.1 hypothetical protein [Paludibacter sp.]